MQRLFVRVVDDRFTVSLDSSGDHLHKRGIKTHAGVAPIRETIAAAALRMAGYDCREVVVDPMCGSGTFALEAAMMARNVPPGWHRSFAFTQWPSFRPGRWAFSRKEAEKRIVPAGRPVVFASDRDPNACALLQRCVDAHGLSETIRVDGQDFFDLVPSGLESGKGLVVINPPYGRRLGTPAESRRLFRDICRRLASEYTAWKIILIPPPGFPLRMIPFGLTPHRVRHGGLMVDLLVGRIG
jgi:putative N6-adenine-specific DNA methylase